jgi:hypothetical protein
MPHRDKISAMGLLRRRLRLDELDERAAYERSYGRGSGDVRIVKLPPRRPRDRAVLASGELMRRAFLSRLDAREEQAAADD